MTVGSSSESRFSEAQWVVARRPISKPAAAYTRLPVQTEVISGTDARCFADPVQVGVVVEHRPGARAAGVDEHVEGRGVVDRVVCAEHQGLGADDGRTVGREAEDVPAVLWVFLRPVGEHLPGTDGVELLDPVEDEQADLRVASGSRRSVWSGDVRWRCLLAWSLVGLVGTDAGRISLAAQRSPSPRSKRRDSTAIGGSVSVYVRARAGRP